MKKILFALVLALTLICVPSSFANTPDEQRDLSIASAYWGTESVCPAASVTIVHDLTTEQPSWAQSWARSWIGGCTEDAPMPDYWSDYLAIRVRPGLTPPAPEYCQILVHEYGHLIGQEHSTDSNSVMQPIALEAPLVPGCAAIRPTAKRSKCHSKSYKRNHPNRCRKR